MSVFNTLNETDISILAAKRLKMSGKSLLTLQSFVPNALNDLAHEVAQDRDRRYLLMTDQTAVTASITAGSSPYADLATVIENYGLMLDTMRLGTTFYLPSVTVTPYINGSGGAASGYYTFTRNPNQGETVAVNGVTFTFTYPAIVASGGGTGVVNSEYQIGGTYEGNPWWYSEQELGTPTPGRWSVIKGYNAFGLPDPNFWQITGDGALYYIENEDGDSHALPYSDDVEWTFGGDSSATGSTPAPTVTSIGLFTAVQVEIGATATDTAANFAEVLNASVNASISVATYSVSVANSLVVEVIYDTTGTTGNSFTLANSSGNSVIRSAATLTGGATTSYGLLITQSLDQFTNLARVQFSTTVTLPTGISASTNYYITDYTEANNTATFNLSSSADGLTPVSITAAGSGVLTMQSYSPTVAQWLSSPNQGLLNQALPVPYTYIWLEQNLLYTSATTGTFSFQVPYQPTLFTLPAQLQNELVDTLVKIAVTAGFSPKAEAA